MGQSSFVMYPEKPTQIIATETDNLMTDNGFYVIFEGSDGAGKTTVMNGVAEALHRKLSDFRIDKEIILTQHPGSTPLGKHIRKLVKFPHQIDPSINIDELSRQMLYMVDTVNFIKTLLEPSLNDGKIIFADRSSFISALVYGVADGLRLQDIENLFDVITPPKADRLIILQLPASTSVERMRISRATSGTDGVGELDHYDKKPLEFFDKINSIYDTLTITSPEQTALVSRSVRINDVKYFDATLPINDLIKLIADDLFEAMTTKIKLNA